MYYYISSIFYSKCGYRGWSKGEAKSIDIKDVGLTMAIKINPNRPNYSPLETAAFTG